MGNTSAKSTNVTDNEQLQRNITELLPKMNDPQMLNQTIDVIKIIDPEFSFLVEIIDNEFAEPKATFINMLPQNHFNYVLDTYRTKLSMAILKLLSTEKLSIWYAENVGKLYCDEIDIVNVVVLKDLLICENQYVGIMSSFLASRCGKMNGTPSHYETVDLLLMTYGDKVEINPETITDNKIFCMVIKYLQNKTKMLQLECDTKESCIKDLEAKLV
jgi:hypothetical protein